MLVELNFFFENGTEDRMTHFKLTIQHYDGCSDGNALQ